MRILITNDDGISAPGLAALEDIAKDLAGPDGEVWVVAPAFEQSAVSHCISYVRPMLLQQLDERRFAVEGSPADCVLAGLHDVMKGTPPDLILAGVNRGHNVAEDIIYSGTISAAREATIHGIRSISMSQYYAKTNVDLPDPFEAARVHGAEICRRLLAGAPWLDQPYPVFYNVNFPPIPAADAKGIKVTVQGHRPAATFGVEPQVAPNGRSFLWLQHGSGNHSAEKGTDARETSEGWITVTPLRADMTANDVLNDLEGLF